MSYARGLSGLKTAKKYLEKRNLFDGVELINVSRGYFRFICLCIIYNARIFHTQLLTCVLFPRKIPRWRFFIGMRVDEFRSFRAKKHRAGINELNNNAPKGGKKMGVSRIINHFEASAYRTTSILMVERARSQLLKDQQDLPLENTGRGAHFTTAS